MPRLVLWEIYAFFFYQKLLSRQGITFSELSLPPLCWLASHVRLWHWAPTNGMRCSHHLTLGWKTGVTLALVCSILVWVLVHLFFFQKESRFWTPFTFFMFLCRIVRLFIASSKPVLHSFCGLAQSILRSILREKLVARRVLRNLWQGHGYGRRKFLYERVPGLEGRRVPWLDPRKHLEGWLWLWIALPDKLKGC